MFATLLGGLPRPRLPAEAPPEAILDASLGLQAEHGLEPVTDGGWPIHPSDAARSWRATAERAGQLVKAVLTGPIASGRPVADIRRDVLALAEAGCRWIEIHEPAPRLLASDDAGKDRSRFADAHRELTADLPGVHMSLAITGGSADVLGVEAILAGAYASLALDLIAGPGNWRLAVAAPTEVGIICGAVAPTSGSDDGPEILVWAAEYAAASGDRGMDRVGLATSGSLAELPWDVAATKVRRLGEAARLAAASPEERRAVLDPRTFDSRSAALGRSAPPPPPRTRGARRHR
jgi:hypothetical protein